MSLKAVVDQVENATMQATPLIGQFQKKPSRRSLIVVIGLALAALTLIVLPRPSYYYPNVIIDAAEELQLDVLLTGRQSQTACDAAATSIANTITAACRECRVLAQTCTKNPPHELRQRFDEVPLPVPSARIANGVILYKSARTETALLTCKESERQAALKGDQAKVACYAPGIPRPHTTFERASDQTAHTTFTLLLAVIGCVIASLIAGILIAYFNDRKRRSSAIPNSTVIQTIPTHAWLETFSLAGVDTAIMLGTFMTIAWPNAEDIDRWNHLDRTSVTIYALVIALSIAWFWILLEHYARRRPFWDELREIVRVLAVMSMVSGASSFVVGVENGPISHLVVWSLNFLLIPIGRASIKQLLDDFGLWRRSALVVGAGENARAAYHAIKGERGMGYQILGFVQLNPNRNSLQDRLVVDSESFPILDASPSLESLLSTLGNPQVILALESLADHESQIQVRRLLAARNSIHIIPAIRGLPLFGTQLSHFFSHEILFLTVRNNLSRRAYVWIKRLFDLCAASLLVLFLSPLLLVLAFLIRRSGGTALYGHMRIGRNGKPFTCLKFRSMRPDADKVLHELLANDPQARAEWELDFKLKNDPRITRVGHFLRRTSLDELPQLFNVLRGDMSLVGPRPIVEAELARYEDNAALYLMVRPGITGLWQISGRNDTTYAERVALDTWYVQNWSLWYDFAILVRTLGVVVSRHGAY